jgi:PHD/YefM family antitoxin component YafN of YafNO toxin-antitoxin module
MTISTISYTFLRQNLNDILDKIEKKKEVFIITKKRHSDVIMIAKDDYDFMQEKLQLLSAIEVESKDLGKNKIKQK